MLANQWILQVCHFKAALSFMSYAINRILACSSLSAAVVIRNRPRPANPVPVTLPLTLEKPPAKSNAKVSHSSFTAYQEARARAFSGLVPALREDAAAPPERLLQAVWFHQRLLRDKFVTLDGTKVQALHPGFWNHESGPDFRGAVLQFAGEAPRSGDVEIDLHSSGWRGHGHDRNPAFQKVALHVVWEGEGNSSLPTLRIKSLLDSPLSELALWFGAFPARSLSEAPAGQCRAPLRELSAADLAELLHQAALLRLHFKGLHLQARARQAGWELALWEGLFRALGYKQNLWPMQRLAELQPRWNPGNTRFGPLVLQSRLLGIGGLLPTELPRAAAAADDYVRRLWDFWWRERDAFNDCAMPRQVWRFSGLRPANHPQRRLALASRWLAAGGLPAQLQSWSRHDTPATQLVPSLLETMRVTPDEFWSWRWTLRSKRLSRPQPLIGAARVTDLAMNAVLPWLWIRAGEAKNEALKSELERKYLAWPPAEDNAVLRLARQRLLGGASAKALRGAAAQQGLLQIVRDFCEPSDALCTRCQFPELVRRWKG